MAFSPDGKLLVSVSEGKAVRLWEVATGRELARFHGHTAFLQAVAFHPDGRQIATGGVDGTVKIWDLGKSRPVVFGGHTGWVSRVAFRRDGRRVASGTEVIRSRPTGDETFKVWNPADGEEDPSYAGVGKFADLRPDFGPGGKQFDRTVTSPDGRRIATDALDEPVVLVKDRVTDRILTTLRGHTDFIQCIAFSPDGKRIATASQDQSIKIWDAEDGRELLTLRGHTHVVLCVAFSPRRPPPRLGERRYHGADWTRPRSARGSPRSGGPPTGPADSTVAVQGRVDQAAPCRRDPQAPPSAPPRWRSSSSWLTIRKR